jgi:hypothetical protein
VLCEHDDAHDELHALLAAPAVELAHSHDQTRNRRRRALRGLARFFVELAG